MSNLEKIVGIISTISASSANTHSVTTGPSPVGMCFGHQMGCG